MTHVPLVKVTGLSTSPRVFIQRIRNIFKRKQPGHSTLTLCSLSSMDSFLTSGELERYFNHIGLPKAYRTEPKPPLDIAFLTALHTHHISTIPYENLSLHYVKDVNISLDVHVILEKFLANGRGGYCMEQNLFFNSVLRSLGFQVYLTGARPRVRSDGIPVGEYLGWYVSRQQQRCIVSQVTGGTSSILSPSPMVPNG